MKTVNDYRTNVLEQNAELKQEAASIGGAVKALVNFEGLNEANKKTLRQHAGGKPIQSSAGRNSIAVAVLNFAKGDQAQVMRKATKKEKEAGAGEYVPKTTFSPYWILQQLHKMRKS